MGLFRKKKKVVKPTLEERKKINRRLQKKYPQMFTENWAQRLKGRVRKELKTRQLERAGLTEKEINRLKGKK